MTKHDTAQAEGPSAYPEAAELELRNVSKRYPGQREPAIVDLSLTVTGSPNSARDRRAAPP